MTISRRFLGGLAFCTAILFALPFAAQAQSTPTTPVPATPAPAPTLAATVAPAIAATPATPATTAPVPAGAASVIIDGSSVVQPAIRQAADNFTAKNAGVTFNIQVSGTDGGFDKFCVGATDINMATKGITDNQAGACAGKNVNFVETLLGYDSAVILVRNDAVPTCLATDEIGKLLAPAATGFTTWSQVNSTIAGEAKLGKVYAVENSRALNLLTGYVTGGQARADIQFVKTAQEAVDKIAFEAEAVAVVSFADFQDAQNQQKAVKALDIKSPTTCTPASLLNFELARYPAFQPLYLYVGVPSLDKKPVADFLNDVVGDGKSVIAAKGFTPASDTTFTRNKNYLTTRQAGRTFSRIQAVNIPADTAGTVLVGGSSVSQPLLKALTDGFTPRYSKVTVTTTTYGDTNGYQKFCANQMDVISAARPATDGEAAACKTNNVTPLTLNLGAEAVVLAVSAQNAFATCLTTDQVAKLLGADADGKVKKWSDVDAKFPATDILIVAPNDGNPLTDLILLRSVKGVAPLPRRDVIQNDDPLYRAAGVGNVEGGVTWLSYAEFKKAVIPTAKAVQIDSGKGCIAPDDKTILDGSYAFSRALTLQFNQSAFSRPEVKAFVWYLLSEDGLTVLTERSTLSGFDREAVVRARDSVLDIFSKQPTPAPTTSGPTAVPTVNLGLQPGQPGQPTQPAVNPTPTTATQ